MRNSTWWLVGVAICVLAFSPAAVPAQDSSEHKHGAADGVIKERHELMEAMGQYAEDINLARKVGVEGQDTGAIATMASQIATNAAKIPGLFPKGSTSPDSRAKADIWQDWATFEADAKKLQQDAAALAQTANTGGEGIGSAADTLFKACKKCHDQFRKPEEKKGE